MFCSVSHSPDTRSRTLSLRSRQTSSRPSTYTLRSSNSICAWAAAIVFLISAWAGSSAVTPFQSIRLDQDRCRCTLIHSIEQIPSYWSWASHISFARWSFEALILNEFAGVSSDDDEDAEYWLKYWHFYGRDVSRAFFRFVCQVAIFHILALVAMRVVSFQRT